jgi:translation initiation factor 1
VKDDHERKVLLMPDRLVYSTDDGRVNTCPTCGKPYKQCQCDTSPSNQIPVKKNDGIACVMRDRKHRGGKTVTVTTGHN